MEEEKRESREENRCAHPLVCADEWKDPEGARVIGEYHKDDPTDDQRRLEEDLDAFEQYWRKKHGINFTGEYHKEGAPFMEEPSRWDGHLHRAEIDGSASIQAMPSDKEEGSREEGLAARPPSTTPIPPVPEPIRTEEATARPKEAPKTASAKAKGEPLMLTEVLDINSLEVVAYWIFRLAFGRELHVPIKREGLMDVDVHIKNKDVVINTNQLYFTFPELVVWHVTYTHKGRPILEIGRGVKGGMKVHRLNALRLFLGIWLGARRSKRSQASSDGKISGAARTPTAKEDPDLGEKGDIT